MIGIGTANIAAGFFQGFAVSTSSSRTAVAEQSGAKSQLTGLVGAGMVALLLLFFNGLLADLPQTALAAVVIAAALSLADLADAAPLPEGPPELVRALARRHGRCRLLRRAARASSSPSCCRSCCSSGAAGGRTARCSARSTARRGGTALTTAPSPRRPPGVLVYRWEAPLFFANAGMFRQQVRHLVRRAQPTVGRAAVRGDHRHRRHRGRHARTTRHRAERAGRPHRLRRAARPARRTSCTTTGCSQRSTATTSTTRSRTPSPRSTRRRTMTGPMPRGPDRPGDLDDDGAFDDGTGARVRMSRGREGGTEMADDALHPELEALMAAGEAQGCLNLAQVSETLAELEVDDEGVAALWERARERGLDVNDDCGRVEVPATRVSHAAVAESTTDAMRLFLNEVARHPLLTPDEERELAQRVEEGDAAAKERMILSNLRLVVSIAQRYQGQGELTLLDMIQEGVLGLTRAVEKFDWRRGFKLLDLRDALDPAGDPARAGQPVADDPPARPRGGAPAARLAGRAHAHDQAGPGPHGRGDRDREPAAGRARGGGARAAAHHHQPGPPGRRGRRHGLRRPDRRGAGGAVRRHRGQPARRGARPRPRRAARAGPRGDHGALRHRRPASPQTLDQIGRRIGVSRERVRQIERSALERLARARESETLRDLAA